MACFRSQVRSLSGPPLHLKIFLTLILVISVSPLARAGTIGPECAAVMLAAAVRAEAELIAVDRSAVRLKYVDDGVLTHVDQDNWVSARYTLAGPGRVESKVYLVSARQIERSAACRVMSAVLVETRAWAIDRTDTARDLAGGHDPAGLLRALEAIDLEFPQLARGDARRVSLIRGDPEAEVGHPILLKYQALSNPAAPACVVQYTRGFTAPRIEMIASDGG